MVYGKVLTCLFHSKNKKPKKNSSASPSLCTQAKEEVVLACCRYNMGGSYMRSWDDSSYVESKKSTVSILFSYLFLFSLKSLDIFGALLHFRHMLKMYSELGGGNIWASMVAVVMAVTVTAAAAGLAVALL